MNADHMTTLPTPLTDDLDHGLYGYSDYVRAMPHVLAHARQLERDCMTLALRLYAEDPDTFAPETREVMKRWRPRVRALLEDKTK